MSWTNAFLSKLGTITLLLTISMLTPISGQSLAQNDPAPVPQTDPADPSNTPDPEPATVIDSFAGARGATVEILVTDGGDSYRHSGVIVAPQTVITTGLSIRGADDIEIVTEGGARLSAEAMSSVSRNQVLAILYVANLSEAPAILAAGAAEKDLIAQLIYRRDGAIATESGAVGTYSGDTNFSHFALAPTHGLGGGLFNDCGELVGLSRPDSDFARRSFRREAALETPRIAATLDAIREAMSEESLQPAAATDTCESEAEKAKRRADELEAEQRQKTEELEELQRQKEADADEANEQLEALKRDQSATEAELREAERKADAARSEADGAKQEAETAREELLDLEADLADAEKELDETIDRVETLEEENEDKDSTIEEQENQILIIAAIGGGLTLLAIIIGILVARGRKKRQVAAEQAALDAAKKADKAGQEVERLRSIPKAIPPYANCLLEGTERNLSLPGELLPEAAGGVVIGRHPANAKAVLESDKVSRQHARVFVRDDTVYMEDLGSTNGTYLNGVKLVKGQPIQVNPGDEIRIDKMRFAFRKI